ncbi:alanine--glyoxylate aminotransferase family protein [Actinoplanes sp. TBRC 11911]|uniref:pyridoxal-phosphate-dependent aminotransferase family protein n=1 Tax=Actinoplanes sp. TBRC 11911 TaxID=2729386 RepID=UPI00145C8E8F|nr:aminotransferase class V-fold PLP-dependent enzyme [Actinoplanes sp. TBRC 11911]NMO53409.1 alanine--glyoxylate aminotransferase family protein [Actinoplanes sp. TBRC 11911]
MSWNPLAAVPQFPTDGYARLADRLAPLLGTEHDVVFVQGEAIVALESAAAELAAPGVSALNIVTSPYGRLFGDWLTRGGAEVVTIIAEEGAPVRAAAVREALAGASFDLVAVVHGEAATGILNPIEAIAEAARQAGALLVVDAVATVGGHPVRADDWDAAIVVIGPQKGLGGPASLSAVAVSTAGWRALAAAERARRPRHNVPTTLSLLDLKRAWLDTGRGALPGMPDPLAFWALSAALDELEAEGVDARISRHRRASTAARAGLRALGVEPWPAADDDALTLVTALPVPDGMAAADFLRGLRALDPSVTTAVGTAANRLVRLNHTAQRATYPAVLTGLAAYAAVMDEAGQPVDIGAGVRAATAAWAS